MTRMTALALLVATFTLPAAGKDPGSDVHLIRMLVCEGEDAPMELYVPQSIVFGKRRSRKRWRGR
jgi:hypothetical protein